MLSIKPDDKVIRGLLADPDTQALVLLTILLHLHGEGVFGSKDVGQLDPAEMWADTNALTGTWIPETSENKVLALITAVEDDAFYTDEVIFTSVVNALYDGDLGDMINGIFEEPSIVEVMWGVVEVELARDEEEGPPLFGRRVHALIGELMQHEAVDSSMAEDEVTREISDMFSRLQRLGVSPDQLRILKAEYDETVDAVEDIAGMVE